MNLLMVIIILGFFFCIIKFISASALVSICPVYDPLAEELLTLGINGVYIVHFNQFSYLVFKSKSDINLYKLVGKTKELDQLRFATHLFWIFYYCPKGKL